MHKLDRPVTIGIEAACINHNRIVLVDHVKMGFWTLPGGKWDGDEEVHMAALRELFEETGLNAIIHDMYEGRRVGRERPAPLPMAIDLRQSPDKFYQEFVYLCETYESRLVLEVGKAHAVRWFDINELMSEPRIEAHTRNYARMALEKLYTETEEVLSWSWADPQYVHETL